MDEKFDLMEKIQKKIFFPWKESVFDEKWREESKKNGLDLLQQWFRVQNSVFWRFGKILCLRKNQQKQK